MSNTLSTYPNLPDSTRVWIYQANRPFPEPEIPRIKEELSDFARRWVSHNQQLRAVGELLYGRFVVLMVDESQAGASGCSIDKSVYFLKGLQSEYGLDLFDRMYFTFMKGDQPVTVSREAFEALYRQGEISKDTLVFDTLVTTKGEFDRGWLKPLAESWHMRLVD